MIFILAGFPSKDEEEPMLEYLSRHQRVTVVLRVTCWFSRPEVQYDVAIVTDYKRNAATLPLAQSLMEFGVRDLVVVEHDDPDIYR